MPFGAHETMQVHEILNEKMNMIHHLSLYAQQAQSGEVRGLIERHLQTCIQDYNQLVGYTHDYDAAGRRMPEMGSQTPMAQISYQDIQYGLHQPAHTAAGPSIRFNDRQILDAVLICHKNSARSGMWASLECADPGVRQMLLRGAIAANNFAYETFLLMNRQGQYQVPTMNDHTAKTLLHTYQPMPFVEHMQQM
jgi:spore coat protein CotF